MYNRSKTILEGSDTRSPNGYRLEAGVVQRELQSVSWRIESVKLYMSRTLMVIQYDLILLKLEFICKKWEPELNHLVVTPELTQSYCQFRGTNSDYFELNLLIVILIIFMYGCLPVGLLATKLLVSTVSLHWLVSWLSEYLCRQRDTKLTCVKTSWLNSHPLQAGSSPDTQNTTRKWGWFGGVCLI